ncbi:MULTISPECIES: hypothetical protein [unclassified Shewanella]|uniref:hypothetical protein n=1 Tax=unclassified Shewanella TaxID=196818 RepID=UPI001BBA5628|nr:MULTISPECIES: hypothetical protein [unclassified Shewanella]GIU17287.1 hypothetical protein TUM4444_30990 [Shewanella sp. MBTL60-112-B1]GIU40254.1 hypothetical protein TUM4445_38990 [Shewanella sp. MBTL60-112-B2]
MAASKVLVWSRFSGALRHAFIMLIALFSAVVILSNTLEKASSKVSSKPIDNYFKIKSYSTLLVKSRYSAGLVCQDKGWEFCARWAQFRRSPKSRIA